MERAATEPIIFTYRIIKTWRLVRELQSGDAPIKEKTEVALQLLKMD